MRKTLTGMTLAAALAATLLTGGCSFADAICGSDDYPVKAVGTTTGQDCVPKGQEPPAGYVRYPKGKVPEHVGDKWDEYWSEVVVDEKGNVVPG
ncbi:hypothetical protein DMB66_31030 [Actinoplanes sp. ATCC 53533]|uniref:SCO0607 family lipoprotein n=1 Tax=Actinoplanes sp. ATCC 53533 TaxID=1288362 RepID=UPI000F76848F|nr:hypothetical protein [Actinoplanes sp. ATCC 53533]RSM58125.1 hypothetical protein DMB66_31030 [Actinoplanes sp. ATCC 53533]